MKFSQNVTDRIKNDDTIVIVGANAKEEGYDRNK